MIFTPEFLVERIFIVNIFPMEFFEKLLREVKRMFFVCPFGRKNFSIWASGLYLTWNVDIYTKFYKNFSDFIDENKNVIIENMTKILEINAREILDSRGNPTVECEVVLEDGKKGWSSVPSGASTGEFEAHELRDEDEKRFGGKGVLRAVKNIEEKISPELIGLDVAQQKKIDQIMLNLDGTENKKKLGANAILAVSMAVCRAACVCENLPLYKYISKIALASKKNCLISRPFFNIINGGMHAGNKIAFQEFMISPNLDSFEKNYQAASEIYQVLKKNLKKDFGGVATLLGDEGGFAPDDFKKAEEALDKIMIAVNDAGYKNKVDIALDIAASEFYQDGNYNLGFKMQNSYIKTPKEMIDYYLELVEQYPIISIEDPFNQSDFNSFAKLTKVLKEKKVQVVADDLTVTNPKRIQMAIEQSSANTLLLKINQIGSITQAIEAFNLAKSDGWKVMVSHRSGETTDDFIADFAIGIGAEQIKSGATARGERVCKYNRILAIEKMVLK